MKIITQITVATWPGEAEKIFGLGDDQKMYSWDFVTGSWLYYGKFPEPDPVEEKVASTDKTTITLFCLNCEAPVIVAEDSAVGRGILNCFCTGECEDRYAARL